MGLGALRRPRDDTSNLEVGKKTSKNKKTKPLDKKWETVGNRNSKLWIVPPKKKSTCTGLKQKPGLGDRPPQKWAEDQIHWELTGKGRL